MDTSIDMDFVEFTVMSQPDGDDFVATVIRDDEDTAEVEFHCAFNGSVFAKYHGSFVWTSVELMLEDLAKRCMFYPPEYRWTADCFYSFRDGLGSGFYRLKLDD